jgi:hypothetical protein
MTTQLCCSILAYDRFSGAEGDLGEDASSGGELINDKYSRAKYLGLECIMETKTGFINATKFCTAASDGKKRFDHYIANARYKNLFNYMSSSFPGELSIQVTAGDYELRGQRSWCIPIFCWICLHGSHLVYFVK